MRIYFSLDARACAEVAAVGVVNVTEREFW